MCIHGIFSGSLFCFWKKLNISRSDDGKGEAVRIIFYFCNSAGAVRLAEQIYINLGRWGGHEMSTPAIFRCHRILKLKSAALIREFLCRIMLHTMSVRPMLDDTEMSIVLHYFKSDIYLCSNNHNHNSTTFK